MEYIIAGVGLRLVKLSYRFMCWNATFCQHWGVFWHLIQVPHHSSSVSVT